MVLNKRWMYAGEYFGYPKCCIKEFVQRGFADDLTEAQESVHQSTGFIPCKKCAEKIINGKTTLAGLIKNRVCSTPFPVDDCGSLEAFILEREHPGEFPNPENFLKKYFGRKKGADYINAEEYLTNVECALEDYLLLYKLKSATSK